MASDFCRSYFFGVEGKGHTMEQWGGKGAEPWRQLLWALVKGLFKVGREKIEWKLEGGIWRAEYQPLVTRGRTISRAMNWDSIYTLFVKDNILLNISKILFLGNRRQTKNPDRSAFLNLWLYIWHTLRAPLPFPWVQGTRRLVFLMNIAMCQLKSGLCNSIKRKVCLQSAWKQCPH